MPGTRMSSTKLSPLHAAVFLTDPSASPPPPQLTTMELAGVEGRSNLWPKVKAGLVAAWERYQDR